MKICFIGAGYVGGPIIAVATHDRDGLTRDPRYSELQTTRPILACAGGL